jgi:DNA adenine methylase
VVVAQHGTGGNNMARTPIIWFGGKQLLAQDIISLMPPHTCYVEPFGGGASVLAAKAPVNCDVYNDIDGDVVNFLMQLRKYPERMREAVNSLPYSRQLYEEWKWGRKPRSKFERAVRWFYLNRCGVASGNNHKTGWRHSKEVNPVRGYHAACDLLLEFAERMKYVQIEQLDFREIIDKYDSPNTLFYIDPPYHGNENRYKGKFTEKDHRDLANILRTIKGKAIVSYYSTPLIEEMYQGWDRIEIGTHKFSRLQAKGTKRDPATEILFKNYDYGQMTIFECQA